MNIKDSETERLGFSDCMGPKLRQFVESQLLLDLSRYASPKLTFHSDNIRFNWSESCLEGHRTYWLDGEIENFSGVAIFDLNERLIAEGWMEFIETETGLEVFWWFLEGGTDYDIKRKRTNQVPKHIWNRLSDELRSAWRRYAPDTMQL